MEKKNIIHGLDPGELVTSAYGDIYVVDEFCEYIPPIKESGITVSKKEIPGDKDEWVSPSDLLIGKIELKPPFTSKITRGKTHEGILSIGDGVLEKERAKFLKHLATLVDDNELSWMYVEAHEKEMVINKVKQIYQNIFTDKSKIMQKEVMEFYEKSLQELEERMRSEVDDVIINAHVQIINDLNYEVKRKLQKEKNILEKVLKDKYEVEVQKLKLYYDLILKNEQYRSSTLINQAQIERNDALKAFCNQIEAENATTTMYVMCTERKKCRVKQFLLENIQSAEIKEKIQKIKERQDLIASYQEKSTHIYDINKKWEEKVNKILQLFLKFISFSLKLLPEQTQFLLDLEKLVVLQLNEIQKAKYQKKRSLSLLIEEDMTNIFQFEQQLHLEDVCEGEPFVIEGDLAESIPTPYGSRETLPSHVDLPCLRLQRQFVYAKCQKFEQVRAFLEAQRCKCHDTSTRPSSLTSVNSSATEPVARESGSVHESESSNEPLLVDDIHRLHNCPVRRCMDWTNKLAFPNLIDYLDFTEEKFEIVKTILGKLPEAIIPLGIIKAKDVAYRDLPFSATKEPYHDVGTQYSSQEDLTCMTEIPECPCFDKNFEDYKSQSRSEIIAPLKTLSTEILKALSKRKTSLRRMFQQHPKLVEIFSDENYDFRL